MKKSAKSKSRGLAARAHGRPRTTRHFWASVDGLDRAASRRPIAGHKCGTRNALLACRKTYTQGVLGEERAAYGEQIVHALSAQLTGEYGSGFSRTNLFYMIRFVEAFPDEQIVHALHEQCPGLTSGRSFY